MADTLLLKLTDGRGNDVAPRSDFISVQRNTDGSIASVKFQRPVLFALGATVPGFAPGTRETIPIIGQIEGMQAWTAKAACKVVSATEVHSRACDAADELTLEKIPNGTEPHSGTVCLAGNFTLNSTVNTNVTINGHATPATAALAAGDSLALKFVSGDGTDWVGVVTVTIEYT